MLLVAMACAPEPTTPSDESLAGVWTANAHLYTLSNFRLEIVQEPTEQAWGSRDCAVRDPAGNLIRIQQRR